MTRRKIIEVLDAPTTTRIFKILAMTSLLVSLFVAFQQYQLTDCLATYNETNNTRTRILTETALKERNAERRRDDALDSVFLDPSLQIPQDERTPDDGARVRRLFAEYLDAARDLAAQRAAADADRSANPVPPPPSLVCG
jgi:hypothetical protein